jgi:hypothetical protein
MTHEKTDRSLLQAWLNSTVLTALVGVVGTGMIGACVSGAIQDRSKQNEIELQARQAQQAARAATMNRVLEVLGTNISAADDLLVTVSNVYAEDRHSTEDLPTLRKWKADVALARDAADAAWRQQRRSLGYMLLYHFDNDADVAKTWREMISRSDGFERCTWEWYTANARAGTDEVLDMICGAERLAYEDAVEGLTAAVTRAAAPQP